jgi:hypothetical protein
MAFLNKRNLEIYDKRKEGWTFRKLSSEFGLSLERIRQICVKAGRIEESLGKDYLEAVKNGTPRPAPVDCPKLMGPVNYVERLFPNEDHNLIVRAINCVGRKFRYEYPDLNKDYRIFLKVLDTMSLKEILTMRNCGVKTAELLLDIQKIERGEK